MSATTLYDLIRIDELMETVKQFQKEGYIAVDIKHYNYPKLENLSDETIDEYWEAFQESCIGYMVDELHTKFETDEKRFEQLLEMTEFGFIGRSGGWFTICDADLTYTSMADLNEAFDDLEPSERVQLVSETLQILEFINCAIEATQTTKKKLNELAVKFFSPLAIVE